MYKKPNAPGFAGAFPWTSLVIVLTGLLGGCIGATQYVVSRFGEQAALGPALFHILGVGAYAPWNWFLWIFRFLSFQDPYSFHTFVRALETFAGSSAAGVVAARIVRWYSIRKKSQNAEDIHGSAKFATKKDLEKAGLLNNKKGLFIGGFHDAKDKMLRYLRHAGPESVCVIAPPRSGKGVSLAVPILLDHAGNALVHDTKKELYYLTAGYRSKELGHRCLLFSPTEPETCGYNPFAEVRLGAEREVADAQNIINLLVRTVEETGTNKHWLDVAESFGLGMALHQLYLAKEKGRVASPIDVYNGLTPFGMTLREYLEAAINYEHDPQLQYGWTTPAGQPTPTHPVVRQKFQEQLNRHEEEFTSVSSALGAAFLVFSDPLVARATSRSDFRMQDLMNFGKPITVYLAVPPSDKKRLSPLSRLMFTMAILKNTESMDASNPVASPDERLVLMVDEAGSVGKMDVLNDALPTLPGYHIQAYLIYHSVEQINQIFGPYNNILAATHVRIAFAPNTIETARTLSGMTGEATIARANYSFSGNRSSMYGPKQMSGHTEYVRRALLTPAEVMQMKGIQKVKGKNGEDLLLPGDMLIFIAGQPPIFGTQTLYLADPEFVRRSQIRMPTANAVIPPFALRQNLTRIIQGAHATPSP